MAEDSSWALQQAVYTALRAEAVLITLAGDGTSPERAKVFDHVPQNETFPYLTIGPTTQLPWDTKDSDGMEHTIEVHCWSQYAGQSEIKRMMAASMDAVDNKALIVTGHTLVLLQFTFGQTVSDPDGITRHGIQRFRALINTP